MSRWLASERRQSLPFDQSPATSDVKGRLSFRYVRVGLYGVHITRGGGSDWLTRVLLGKRKCCVAKQAALVERGPFHLTPTLILNFRPNFSRLVRRDCSPHVWI